MIKNSPRRDSGRAFTLVELLVVITIIAILMGLLFPAVGAARQSALRTVAKNAATGVVVGITQYYTEYGYYPDVASTTTDAELMEILRGKDAVKNPRKIPFFSYKDAKSQSKPRDGYDESGTLRDPWGGTYKIVFDSDYDNQVTATDYGNKILDVGAAVWTFGRDGKKGNNGTLGANNSSKGTDDVVSWE